MNAPKSFPEPLQPTEIAAPWSIVALDHKGPLCNGSYALVMIDCGSRYTVIHQVKSTSFENNLACLTQTSTLFGPPKQVISDNGPPFQGEKFRNDCNDFGIKRRKTTAAWPKANARAENLIKKHHQSHQKRYRIQHTNNGRNIPISTCVQQPPTHIHGNNTSRPDRKI